MHRSDGSILASLLIAYVLGWQRKIYSVLQEWFSGIGAQASGVKTPRFLAIFGTTEVVP
jgi:hypothetical protein